MFRKPISVIVAVGFMFSLITPTPKANAKPLLGLPEPGAMVSLSPAYEPVIIKGVSIHKDNPFLFDFIVDTGQDHMAGDALKQECDRLVKYFLASLAIPEKDMWVNLSPYEKERTIPQALGQTEMGRDLLAQDYMLKQITASLIYPEKELGKSFWERVYSKARQLYGTSNVPINTFNKVWIMADRAEVFEHDQTAFVVDCHLKVMLEEDYLALKKHSVASPLAPPNDTHSIASNIVKEIILPEIEKEVNTGKNFAKLRQIFNSIILSSWYKNNLKQALLNQVYANKEKVKGIDLNDPNIKNQIYERYLLAYKKGVFNFIKEDNSAGNNAPRKYFSGGIDEAMAARPKITMNPLLLNLLLLRGQVHFVRLKVWFRSKYPVPQKFSPRMEKLLGSIENPPNDEVERAAKIALVEKYGLDYYFTLKGISRRTRQGKLKINLEDVVSAVQIQYPSKSLRVFSSIRPTMPAKEALALVEKNREKNAAMTANQWEDKVKEWRVINIKLITIINELRKEIIPAPPERLQNKKLYEETRAQLHVYYDKAEGRDFIFLKYLAMGTDKNLGPVKEGILAIKEDIALLKQRFEQWRAAIDDRLKPAVQEAIEGINALGDQRPSDASPGEANPAMVSSDIKSAVSPTGGIDLNTTDMDWDISKDGQGVEINVDPAMIERARRDGLDYLSPYIFSITTIASISTVLGLKN